MKNKQRKMLEAVEEMRRNLVQYYNICGYHHLGSKMIPLKENDDYTPRILTADETKILKNFLEVHTNSISSQLEKLKIIRKNYRKYLTLKKEGKNGNKK